MTSDDELDRAFEWASEEFERRSAGAVTQTSVDTGIRECCQTRKGSKHQNWCENSQSLLPGYETRIPSARESQDAKTSKGNTATLNTRRKPQKLPDDPY